MELGADLCRMDGMDLLSYYRHQAGSARRLAGMYQTQHQTKTALERVAQEYDGVVDDLEKWCGRQPEKHYTVAAYIDWRARLAFTSFEATPLDQPIRVSRKAVRANVKQGRRTDIETWRRTTRRAVDELMP